MRQCPGHWAIFGVSQPHHHSALGQAGRCGSTPLCRSCGHKFGAGARGRDRPSLTPPGYTELAPSPHLFAPAGPERGWRRGRGRGRGQGPVSCRWRSGTAPTGRPPTAPVTDLELPPPATGRPPSGVTCPRRPAVGTALRHTSRPAGGQGHGSCISYRWTGRGRSSVHLKVTHRLTRESPDTRRSTSGCGSHDSFYLAHLDRPSADSEAAHASD